MTWDWIATMGTVVVALAGIGATLRTSAQGRKHAEHLATESHRRQRLEALRQERLRVYADALAHAVAEERRLDTVWAVGGGAAHNVSPSRPGGSLALTPMDAVGVRVHLLADAEVQQAWADFDGAWERYHWWGANEYSGDPNEDAPDELEIPLRAAIGGLKSACKRALE